MKLMLPTIEYADEIISYRNELLEAEDSFDGTSRLKRIESPAEWIKFNESLMNKETVSEGMVQATQFIYVRETDNRVVGMINVRHNFNDFLEKYGGNIGYSIRPSERRKGYAKNMLKEALEFCKEWGMSKVLITCLSDNEASRRTILANGGIYESTVKLPDSDDFLERYWIEA